MEGRPAFLEGPFPTGMRPGLPGMSGMVEPEGKRRQGSGRKAADRAAEEAGDPSPEQLLLHAFVVSVFMCLSHPVSHTEMNSRTVPGAGGLRIDFHGYLTRNWKICIFMI